MVGMFRSSSSSSLILNSLVLFIVFLALVYINATEEFRKHRYYGSSNILKRLSTPDDDESNQYTVGVDDGLPVSVDWREKGAVTEVKNQGQCGSCWVFSTIAVVEGLHKIEIGQLMISLSEQELVDFVKISHLSSSLVQEPELVDSLQIIDGCEGGWIDDALQYIVKNGVGTHYPYDLADGFEEGWEEHPYKVRYGECQKHNIIKHSKVVVSIDGYQHVPTNNEKALQRAVSHQPVIACIALDDGDDFTNYQSSVFNGSCGTNLNMQEVDAVHSVVIVGYDTDIENGMDYWIVKNSWGTRWGENGYIRIQPNVAQI